MNDEQSRNRVEHEAPGPQPEARLTRELEEACAKYGLPTSLSALLRHIENNHKATLGAKDWSIKALGDTLESHEQKLALLGDLDALEARATEAITRLYKPMLDDTGRFWAQKGIEGMRLAVAEILEDWRGRGLTRSGRGLTRS